MRLVFWADRAGAAARVSVPADLQGARSAFSAARSLPGPAVRPCIRRRSAAFQRRRVRPVRAAFCAGSKRCSALRRQPRPMGGACACFGAVCLLRQRRSAPAVLSPCAGRPSGDEVGFFSGAEPARSGGAVMCPQAQRSFFSGAGCGLCGRHFVPVQSDAPPSGAGRVRWAAPVPASGRFACSDSAVPHPPCYPLISAGRRVGRPAAAHRPQESRCCLIQRRCRAGCGCG